MRSKTCLRAPSPPSDFYKSFNPLLLHILKRDYYEADSSDGDEEGDDADEEDDDDELDLLVKVTEVGPNRSAGAPSSKLCVQ